MLKEQDCCDNEEKENLLIQRVRDCWLAVRVPVAYKDAVYKVLIREETLSAAARACGTSKQFLAYWCGKAKTDLKELLNDSIF